MNGAEAKPLAAAAFEIDHPVIVQCERRILALKRYQSEGNVTNAIEVGALLRRVKSSLKRGFWGRWLHDHVRFTHRSAERLMTIAGFAQSNPKSLSEIKFLGPNKLYTLAQLSPHSRQRMLAQHAHQTGRNGPRKTLAQMSLTEFNALARSFDGHRRQQSPALRELLRRGILALEGLCRVLPQLKGRCLPDGVRSDRFKELLTRARGLLIGDSDDIVPAQR